MYKKYSEMTKEDKQHMEIMSGKMLVWMTEGRATYQMARYFDMNPRDVEANIDEMMYILRKHVGLKRFIKSIFIK